MDYINSSRRLDAELPFGVATEEIMSGMDAARLDLARTRNFPDVYLMTERTLEAMKRAIPTVTGQPTELQSLAGIRIESFPDMAAVLLRAEELRAAGKQVEVI